MLPDAVDPRLLTVGACGIDEVGRGALAGPLVAAAVILQDGFTHPLLRDSKLLSSRQRDLVEPLIRQACVDVAVVEVAPIEIDRRGVGWANRWAFEQLMESVAAPLYLLDGNLRLDGRHRHLCVIGGDRLVPAIAAASIVAKVHRDRLMVGLSDQHPHYGWQRNKGYGSAEHLDALATHGPSSEHRLSFLHLQASLPL